VSLGEFLRTNKIEGGVASLIFLLSSHNVEAQKKSVEELFTLSTAGEYKESIITSNGIPTLFAALNSEPGINPNIPR
jgi:hypothetical protein